MPPLFLRGVPTQEQRCDVKMRRKPAPSPATLRFLAPNILLKRSKKKWTINKVVKMKKEKEIVLIVIDMFLFVKHLI